MSLPLPQTTGSLPQSLPKTIKEYYVQFNKEQPLMGPNIRGFMMSTADHAKTVVVTTQEGWESAILHGHTQPMPTFGLNITGSVLLSAFSQGLGITVDQCLDMGYDPNVTYLKEGTNALHFAMYYARWEVVMRLVTEFGMSLVQNDGQGKPSFHYAQSHELSVEFVKWLKTRPDLDQIVEANRNVGNLPFQKMFREFAAEKVLKELMEKEKQDQEKAAKMIEELTEKVKLLEMQAKKSSAPPVSVSDFVTTSVAVTAPVVTPVVVTPTVNTPVVTPIVSTPVVTPIVSTPVVTPIVSTPVVTPIVSMPVVTSIVSTPVVTPIVSTPVVTPVVSTPVATPAPAPYVAPVIENQDKEKQKEKEKDESVKLVSLKAAIDTTRVFWGQVEEHKQMMKWLDQLVLILESKDSTELKIKKIRSSFQTVAMFGNEKTKQWIQENHI